MELFYRSLEFVTKVLLLGLALRYVSKQLVEQELVSAGSWTLHVLSIKGALAVLSVYEVFIFPWLLDPLARLPSVTIVDFRELLPVTSSPRGELASKWTKSFPGADLINIRVFPGNQAIMLVSPQAYRDVLVTHGEDFEKPEAGTAFLSSILGYGLILSKGAAHKHQRKHLNPSFRIQNIRSLQPLMAVKTKLMLERIQQEMQSQGKIEICSWGSRLTMDIIGPTLMSKDFQALTSPESPLETAFAEIIAPSLGQTLLFASSLWLPQWIVRNLPVSTNRMIDRNSSLIRGVCRKILDEKFVDVQNHKFDDETGNSDILGGIIASQQFSREEIVDQMVTFLAAGHETTASSIAWATHLLTLPEYLHYQEKLREEIREAMRRENRDTNTPDGILSYACLDSLPYLNGICQEVLRLYPPVTNLARKAVKTTTVAGNIIPKNMLVVLFPWVTNRNPELWGDDAGQMVPERWIDKLPDGSLRANRSGGTSSNMCEQTFLHGHRTCIGRDFAKAELRYIVASLFSQYEVRRLPGDDGIVVPAGALTIKPRGGLYVSVRPA